jgi:hypothetical protein
VPPPQVNQLKQLLGRASMLAMTRSDALAEPVPTPIERCAGTVEELAGHRRSHDLLPLASLRFLKGRLPVPLPWARIGVGQIRHLGRRVVELARRMGVDAETLGCSVQATRLVPTRGRA